MPEPRRFVAASLVNFVRVLASLHKTHLRSPRAVRLAYRFGFSFRMGYEPGKYLHMEKLAIKIKIISK